MQDSRARLAGLARVRDPKFEVSELRIQNFELRIAPFSHVSRFTRHDPWTLADCFSILLCQPGPLREGRGLPDPLFLCIHDIPDEGVLDEKAASR